MEDDLIMIACFPMHNDIGDKQMIHINSTSKWSSKIVTSNVHKVPHTEHVQNLEMAMTEPL